MTIRRAFLRFFNKDRTFALFQLDDESEDFPHSVRTSQLIATDQFDFQESFAGKRIWSVGYASEEDERYPKYWELLRHVVSHDKSQVIEDMHEVSVSYSVDPSSPDTKKIHLKPPKFDAIFHPNERILLLGKIISHPSSPRLWYHSIPGWFGISGALIGFFTINEHGKLTPTIIGMCKAVTCLANRPFILIKNLVAGGEVAEEFNSLLPFTSDMVLQIHAIVRAKN